MGNITLGRYGDVWPVAGGASNCSGKGGPMTFSRGVCTVDNGNCQLVNVEVNVSGVENEGGWWSQELVDIYFTLSNAINAYLGNQPDDITSHALGGPPILGYTDRKIDPSPASYVLGPWQPSSVNSSGTWSLADMRAEALRRATTIPPQEDDMTEEQAAQLAEIHTALLSAQPGFPDPSGSGGNLNAVWAALWCESLIATNVLGALGDIQRRLDVLEQ